MSPVATARFRDGLCRFAATYAGSGLAPVAPGTFGTLAALLTVIAIHELSGFDPSIWIGLVAGASMINLLLGPWIRRTYSSESRDSGEADAGLPAEEIEAKEIDPGSVVIDECAGFWLSLAPLAWYGVTYPRLLLAFVLFRIFDIAKPLGIRRVERVGGVLGILVDDLVAGLYAGLLVTVTLLTRTL